MGSSEKKIVLVIAEGKSDRTAFKKCINNYLVVLANSINIDFEVYKTDIRLHNFCCDKVIPTDDIDDTDLRKRIVDSISGFLNEQKAYNITIKDIIAVAILCDLDACYCKDDDVVSVPAFNGKYDLANKKINTTDVPYQRELNRWKRDSHDLLKSINKIEYDKMFVPVKSFYQSINLEHITANDPNIEDQSIKNSKARDFRNYYQNKPNDFYQLMHSLSKIGTDFASSWNKLDLANKSFDCMSNIIYLLEWIITIATACK